MDTKGQKYMTDESFLSWDIDSAHVDLESELQALIAQAPEGEEARNDLIAFASCLLTPILCWMDCIKNSLQQQYITLTTLASVAWLANALVVLSLTAEDGEIEARISVG
uniref:Uncharacterized protein n=1 Tax=Timema douglasi TaxID=61478 RepID=A0A7R8Z4L8_TIMDO|nr:unnamed protein product [Timema douglasi]